MSHLAFIGIFIAALAVAVIVLQWKARRNTRTLMEREGTPPER
ncbi:MAG: hypothetical protein NTW19_18710 [Planctomycetota bacterium]|nr:hypothetical protein [Planctomycetota bacterium]